MPSLRMLLMEISTVLDETKRYCGGSWLRDELEEMKKRFRGAER